MNEFLATNPGLDSRFTQRVEFPNYSTAELIQILEGMAAKDGYSLDDSARVRAAQWLDVAAAQAGGKFGNARTVRNLMGTMRRNLARRTIDFPDDSPELDIFSGPDVPDA